MLKKLARFLVINKWRTSLGYNTISFLGIGIVVAKTIYDIILQFFHVSVSIFLLFILGVLSLWVTGYFYDKLGLWSIEGSYQMERNQFMRDIKEGVNKKNE